MESSAATRVVLDTNQLVSAYIFPKSTPGKVFDLVSERFRLLVSMDVALELADVLRRPTFDRYLSLERRDELLAATIRDSEFIATTTLITDCRNAKDSKFLELAVDGRAAHIVTGDADLIVLHPFRGIPILTPHDFVAQFGGE